MDGLGTASGFDSPMDENGWLPIETAPKDGTVILVSVDGRVRTAAWGGAYCNHETREWVRDWCDNIVHVVDPSHWQPLPNPPVLKEQGE